MPDTNQFGYKKVFGIIMPSWVTEKIIKTFVASVLAVVVMLFVLILVVLPKRDDIAVMESTLKNDIKNLESLKSSYEGIERMSVDLSEKELETIMMAVPLEYSPERAIFVLRQIAADTGVSIVSYKLPSGVLLDSKDTKVNSATKEMVEMFSYVVKLTVSAPVETILKFVSKIESSLPYGVVSDLNVQEVTKLTKSSSGKSVQMALDLKYFQSRINPININKIETLTQKNIEDARQMVKYNLFVVPEETFSAVPESSSSGNIFGF